MDASEIDEVRFSLVQYRPGYDIGEVDDFLDLVGEQLTLLHAARDSGGPLPASLESPRFTRVRFRAGYDRGEVDSFVARAEELIAELRA